MVSGLSLLVGCILLSHVLAGSFYSFTHGRHSESENDTKRKQYEADMYKMCNVLDEAEWKIEVLKEIIPEKRAWVAMACHNRLAHRPPYNLHNLFVFYNNVSKAIVAASAKIVQFVTGDPTFIVPEITQAHMKRIKEELAHLSIHTKWNLGSDTWSKDMTGFRVPDTAEYKLKDHMLEWQCLAFDTYKRAINVMDILLELTKSLDTYDESFEELESIYEKWFDICPPYMPMQKVSLLNVSSGYYTARGNSPETSCCKSVMNIDERRERGQYYLNQGNGKMESIRYGDRVGVGSHGVYLSNDGPLLNWYKRFKSDREEWRIENSCEKNFTQYGDVRMNDLIMFHSMADGGEYFTGAETEGASRSKTLSVGSFNFAIMTPNCSFPTFV